MRRPNTPLHRHPSGIFILGLLCVSAFRNVTIAAPTDVPHGHWAAKAVQGALSRKFLGTLSDGKFHGDQPVTRYELAVALDRFVQYIEAGRKPLHALPVQKALTVPPSADKSTRSALLHLSANGFLPPTSPILHGRGTESVTAQQLSDALAQVTTRLSDRALPPAQV